MYEEQAPTGYSKAARIEFVVDAYGRVIRDGKIVSAIVMVDQKIGNSTTVTQRPAGSTAVSSKSTTGTATKGTTTTAKTAGAKTGDDSPIMMYIILLMAAGAVIVVIRRRGKAGR